MALGPLIQRELTVAARRGGTHWARVRYGFFGGLFGILWSLLATRTAGGTPAISGVAFLLLWPMVFFGFTYGVRLTADELSSEKREGTLGLLFLSGMGARSIVLFKFLRAVVRGANVFLAVVPGLVVIAVVERFDVWRFVRLGASLGAVVVLALSIGLAVSAFVHARKTGEGAAGMILILLWIGLPLLDQALGPGRPGWPAGPGFGVLSPFVLVSSALTPAPVGAPTGFRQSLVAMFAGAAGCLTLASWRLGRERRDLATTAPAVVPPPTAARGPRGRIADARRAAEMSVNPIRWLSAREARGRWVLPTILASCAVLGTAATWWFTDRELFLLNAQLLTLAGWYLAPKFLLAETSGRFLFLQRTSGALEFVLATAIGVDDILKGHVSALWQRYRVAVAWFAVLGLALMATLPMVRDSAGAFVEDPWVLVVVVATAFVLLMADLRTLAWFGMWVGLRERRWEHVAGSVAFWVLVLPGLVAFFLGLFLVVSLEPREAGTEMLVRMLVWLVVGLAADGLLIAWSRRSLRRRFREFASPAYLEAGPFDRVARRLGIWYGRRFGRSKRGRLV